MSRGNMILLVIILILILIIFSGVAWFVVRETRQPDVSVEGMKYDIGKSVLFAVSEDGIISNLNTNGTKSKAVAKVKPQLCVADEKIAKELEARKPVVIDIFITILRSKTLEDMQKPDSKETIKAEVIRKLNQSFNTDKILDVFFEEFIIQ